MKIIIVGAGFTGVQLARRLINENNEVCVIDNNEETVRHASNRLDCTVTLADGNNLQVLEDAGIAKANALVCVTGSDEINMITCSLVDAVYPNILKIARVRNFAYHTNNETAKKTHASTFSGKHRPLYGIDYMINPDVEAAEAVNDAIENGAISDVVAFDNSEYELTRIRIEEKSKLAGQKLQVLRTLVTKPFLVAYIESEGHNCLPSGSTVLEAGNCIGVLSKKGDVGEMLELCGTQTESIKKIAIVGAGKIGRLVADKFFARRKTSFFASIFSKKNKTASKFAIIDSDNLLTKEASEAYPNASVFCGDITDDGFLEEEGITDYDLVVCVTHNHELNMVAAAYIESLGVEKTVSLVDSSQFAEIARKLGVDVPIPLRDTIVDSIMSHLRGKSVTGIHTVCNGDFEIIECSLPADSSVAGKTLLEISKPGVFLVMLVEKAGSENYMIPVGNTVLEAEDKVILICAADETKNILKSFGGK